MASEEQSVDADEVSLDPEAQRLAAAIERNEAELAELLELLVSAQELAEDLAPELQTVVRENRGELEDLRMAFEREETLVLLRRLGDESEELVELLDVLHATRGLLDQLVPELVTVMRENRGELEDLRMAFEKEETLTLLQKVGEHSDTFIEVLNRWDATHDLLEELLPELITVVRENRGDLERLRMAFEKEETLDLLEKLGDNTDTLVEMVELLDVTYDLAEDLVPEATGVARENREPLADLRMVVSGFADARRERGADVDPYEFGRNLDNLASLTETVAQPEVSGSLESALSAFEEDAENIQPVGLFGLLGVLRDREVKLALGRLVEAARRLARAGD
jgi:uncharacterized protein YjgD (DUF1641 family)